MDQIDDGLEHAGVGLGVDAVAEVEDVAGMLGAVREFVVTQHLLGALERRLVAGEHQCRIEVALHDDVVAETSAGVADPGAPVESHHGGASCVHRFEEVIAADAEVDPRRIGMAPAEFTEHVAGVGEHVAVVVTTAERSCPRIEQLERCGTVRQLGVDERDRRLGEALHHVVPQHLVGVDQGLGVPVVLARPPFDQVARNGERRTGEGEQWHVEFGDEPFDGRDHVVDVVEFERPKSLDVVARSQRMLRDRAGAGCHVDAESDGVRCHDDVAEEHRGIDPVTVHGLHRDLGGEFGLLDGLEDGALAANTAVFGK